MRKGVRNMKKGTNLPPSQKQAGRKRKGKRKGMCMDDRPLLEQNAAGVDIGAREIFVAVPPDRDAYWSAIAGFLE